MGKNYWEAEFTGLSHLSDFTDVCVVWFAKMSEFINLHKFGKTNKLWSPFAAKSGINQLDFASNSGCMLSKTSCYLCHGCTQSSDICILKRHKVRTNTIMRIRFTSNFFYTNN